MNLLDLMRAPRVVVPIDPDGQVVQGDAQESFRWKQGYRGVEIELHPHEGGLWMWSVSFSLSGGGSGYKVGAKWGRFAANREDALHYAIAELTECLDRRAERDPMSDQILSWAAGLR